MIFVVIDVAKDKHDCFITNSDGKDLVLNHFLFPFPQGMYSGFISQLFQTADFFCGQGDLGRLCCLLNLCYFCHINNGKRSFSNVSPSKRFLFLNYVNIESNTVFFIFSFILISGFFEELMELIKRKLLHIIM